MTACHARVTGRGGFVRDLAHVERDPRACLLSSQGWSQSRIAAELGYANRGEVSKTIRRVPNGDGATDGDGAAPRAAACGDERAAPGDVGPGE